MNVLICWLFIYLCVYHCTGGKVRGQILKSLSTMWVLGIEFGSSGLLASTFCHGAISPQFALQIKQRDPRYLN